VAVYLRAGAVSVSVWNAAHVSVEGSKSVVSKLFASTKRPNKLERFVLDLV
jgi:hypothetical protein